MMVVVLARSYGVVEAVTDPGDIEALKQVSTDPLFPFLYLATHCSLEHLKRDVDDDGSDV